MLATTLQEKPLQEFARWHRVLAVDDERAVLSALRRSLGNEPYDFITSDKPEVALEWIRKRDVSLVIVDLRMPGMDGSKFLEGVWKSSPETSGLVLTAFPEHESLSAPVRRRVHEIVSKPWDDRDLQNVIRQILAAREMESDRVGQDDYDGPDIGVGD